MQMDWLITSLLKLSRLDAGVVVFQRGTVEVNELIRSSLCPFLITMDLHRIIVQVDAPEGVIIQGDNGWLVQAIQNILKNCMESAGDDGLIEIVCKDNVLFTEIMIHDNGAGFNQEDRGKSTGVQGYGIGLALCRMIITSQGGTVTAKNHPRGGAVFTIRFPK